MNKCLILLFSFFSAYVTVSMEPEIPNLKKIKSHEEVDKSEHVNKKIKYIDLFDETIGKVLEKEPFLTEERKKLTKQRLQGFDSFCWVSVIRNDHVSFENFNEYNEKTAELFEHWINDPDLKFIDDKQKIGILTHHIQSACRDGQPELIPILLQHGAKKLSSLCTMLMQGYQRQLEYFATIKQAANTPKPKNSFILSESSMATIFRNMQNNPNINIQKFLLPIYVKGMTNLINSGIDINQNKEFAGPEAYDGPEEMYLNPRYTEWEFPLSYAIQSQLPVFAVLLLRGGANPFLKYDDKSANDICKDLIHKNGINKPLMEKCKRLFTYYAVWNQFLNKKEHSQNYFFSLLPVEIGELFVKFMYGTEFHL